MPCYTHKMAVVSVVAIVAIRSSRYVFSLSYVGVLLGAEVHARRVRSCLPGTGAALRYRRSTRPDTRKHHAHVLRTGRFPDHSRCHVDQSSRLGPPPPSPAVRSTCPRDVIIIGNETAPKIVINNAINSFFKLQSAF